MKTPALILSFSLAALLGTPVAFGLQATGSQSLLSAGEGSASLAADPSAGTSADDTAYGDGVRAINAGKWSDAVAIFSRLAAQGGDRAEGALYWLAYVENKQGQSSSALETCGTLRRDHAGSSWIEECGALEIEIRAKSGQPVAPKAEQSDDLKLLALASLMQRDEKKGLAQIDQILNSNDSSEKLKQGALYIMGQHHSDTIYPQIARLSFIDGDVRIQRGQEDPHHKDVTWEAAASGVPIEAGYSIVTGDGRAEVELEDASTLYLAPNSVLTINDLSTFAGIPHTDFALLSGTVTLHVHPYVAGETFLLRTPTDNLFVRYPMSSNVRLTSYLDGIAIAGIDKARLDIGSSSSNQIPLPEGQTLYFKEGKRILEAGPIHPDDFSSWDHWVANRYATRTEAMSEVAKEAGLAAPLPGMAEMKGQGRFFACQPYGMCWEPNSSPASSAFSTASAQTASAQAPAELAEHAVAQTSSGQTPAGQTSKPARNIQFIGPPAASGPPPVYAQMDSLFPCVSAALAPAYQRAILPANAAVSPLMAPAWAYTICNSGSWIFENDRYLWVAGHRHHGPCVHWVKFGHTVGFVPIHPRDVRDHPPVNRRAPIFVVNPKDGSGLHRVAFDNAHPIELMKEPPKEFRSFAPMPLPRVADPHMVGHQLHDTIVAKGAAPIVGTLPRPTGIPITFDHRSQSFMMPNHIGVGNRLGAGFTPITNPAGNLQSHSGSFSGSVGGNGFHGGYSASGGSVYHGGAGGGGGFHGGATMSSAGGGAAHSSPSLSTSSASAPAASSAAQSSASSSPHR